MSTDYDVSLGCFKEVMVKPTIDTISAMVERVNKICGKFVVQTILQTNQTQELTKEDFPEEIKDLWDTLTPEKREEFAVQYDLRKKVAKPTNIVVDNYTLGNYVHIKELSVPSTRKPICAGAKVLGFTVYKADQEKKGSAEYLDVAPLVDGTYLVVKALDDVRIGTAQRNVTDPATKKIKRVCHGVYDRLKGTGISYQGCACQTCKYAPHTAIYEAGKEKDKSLCVASLEHIVFIVGRLVSTETTPEGEIKVSYSQPTMIGPLILSLTGKWGYDLVTKTDFKVLKPVVVKITSMEMEGSTTKQKVIKTGSLENPIIKSSTRHIGAAFKMIIESRHLPQEETTKESTEESTI